MGKLIILGGSNKFSPKTKTVNKELFAKDNKMRKLFGVLCLLGSCCLAHHMVHRDLDTFALIKDGHPVPSLVIDVSWSSGFFQMLSLGSAPVKVILVP